MRPETQLCADNCENINWLFLGWRGRIEAQRKAIYCNEDAPNMKSTVDSFGTAVRLKFMEMRSMLSLIT
jgi:hypothetical protein